MMRFALATLLIMGSYSAAPASCRSWDVSGPFVLRHRSGLTLIGEFQQAGETLGGHAEYYSKTLAKGADIKVVGTLVQGVVDGNDARFNVTWRAAWKTCGSNSLCEHHDWSSTGVYRARITENGEVWGVNFDLRDPNNKDIWSLADAAKCADVESLPVRPAETTTVAPNPFVKGPGHRLGKKTSICRSGYVWRQARPSDLVCVTPESRTMAARENQAAASRVDANGASGPDSCSSGFVWREAFEGDLVCVTPERRSAVSGENQDGPARTQ